MRLSGQEYAEFQSTKRSRRSQCGLQPRPLMPRRVTEIAFCAPDIAPTAEVFAKRISRVEFSRWPLEVGFFIGGCVLCCLIGRCYAFEVPRRNVCGRTHRGAGAWGFIRRPMHSCGVYMQSEEVGVGPSLTHHRSRAAASGSVFYGPKIKRRRVCLSGARSNCAGILSYWRPLPPARLILTYKNQKVFPV